MIAATLSTFVLAGILSAFVLIGRSGFLASSYSELESESRRGLEIFGADVRKATNIAWQSPQSITLFVATATGNTPVTYAYDADPASSTYRSFYRQLGTANSGNPKRVLIRGVAPDFAFGRFKLEQPGVEQNIANSDLETKQLEVTFRASRGGTTLVAANQSAVSARYILRNKRVAN